MRSALAVPLLCACAARPVRLPTGALLSPLGTVESLDPGLKEFPHFRAGQPAALAVSPDGTMLLTLTSGFNRIDGKDGQRRMDLSSEWIFVHALGDGPPRKLQAIPIANAFLGLAWASDSRRFWTSGGVDDVVHEFASSGGEFSEVLPPIPLGHAKGLGIDMKPMAAGLAVSGGRLVVANWENDSITVVDLARRSAVAELDLRPGKLDPALRGRAGGEFPVAVAFSGTRAFVSCVRDDEVVEIDVAGEPKVVRRVRAGERPVAVVADGARVYVVDSGSDEVVALEDGAVVARWPVLDPSLSRGMRGANPSALAIHKGVLYVALGAINAISAIPLDGGERALFPTGWYPAAVATDGRRLFVANARSVAGPNPGACRDREQVAGAGKASLAPGLCRAANQYVWQLVKGSLQSFPIPSASEARSLTAQAAANVKAASADELFGFLRTRIRHVIYVIKENRTYDQVLGDLAGADGDPKLAIFPEALTPNHHALAREFVTFDRFFVSGQVSGDGWNWSTAARTSHVTEMEIPLQYARRGLSYDYEGQNRNVNVSLPQRERRARNPEVPDDDDLLPGPADVASPGTGYLWSGALRAGLTLRNYGFFGDDRVHEPNSPGYLPPSRSAFAERALQFIANEEELRERSDPYFRTFDMRFPDYWNLREWEREFDGYAARGDLPALSLVRLAHDHFGNFGAGLDGVDTPDTQMADNDYSLGLLVEKVASSRYAGDTVILALEDDAQDGPDHVDAHRSLLFAAGAHVRRGAVISAPHTTVEVVRTIEELLGIAPLSLLDAGAPPIADLFEREERPWTFRARIPAVLRSTKLPLPAGPVEAPRGTAAQWQRATEGFDFSTADALDAPAFNQVLVDLLGTAP
jgi:DNA-binding beta-propeller fold protein YncE